MLKDNRLLMCVLLCFRYKGYRHPPWAERRYKYTEEYWHIMAAQVIFIVVFEVKKEIMHAIG